MLQSKELRKDYIKKELEREFEYNNEKKHYFLKEDYVKILTDQVKNEADIEEIEKILSIAFEEQVVLDTNNV